MVIENLKNEETKEETVVPVTTKKTTKKEDTTEDARLKLSRKELVEMLDAGELKYKKLKTAKNTQKKELDEAISLREQDALTIAKLTEGLGLANDEAASMSETLRIKNSTSKVIEGAIRDYMLSVDIAKRNLTKILLSMGVDLLGKGEE